MGNSSGSDDAQSQSYSGKGKMGADGNKEKSSTGGFGVSGGSTHMLTGMTVGTQKPGQSAQMGRSSDKYASGGNNKDVGAQFANPQEAGHSGHTTSSGNKWGVEGGKGHMFGHTGSAPAKPA